MTRKPHHDKASFLTVAFPRSILKIILVALFLIASLIGAGLLLFMGKTGPLNTQAGTHPQQITPSILISSKPGEEITTKFPEGSPTTIPISDNKNGKQLVTSMGDTLVGYNYVITVDEIAHATSFTNYYSANQDDTLLALYVIVESQSEMGVEVNPQYWRLYDDQTFSYPEVGAGKDPSLVTNRALIKGEKLQGWITFEIPKDANRFKLAYDIPNISEKVSFIFDVGYGY